MESNSKDPDGTWQFNWHLLWTILPLFAFVISFSAGFGVLIFFPFLLSGAHFWLFRNLNVSRKRASFAIPAIVTLIGTFSGLFYGLESSGRFFLIFYISQSLLEVCFARIFHSYQIGSWSIGNLLALGVWLPLAIYFPTFVSTHLERHFWLIILLGCLSNYITGYFLLQGLKE